MADKQGLFNIDPVAAELYRQFGLEPNADRLSVLPRYSKKDGWVAPQMLYDAARAFVSPKVAMDGNYLPPEEAVNTGMALMGGGSVGTAPKGSLRTFIGRNAKTWNPQSHAVALEMEKAGAKPQQIWEQTGNWKAPDGQWRQEISDHAADFRFDFNNATGRRFGSKPPLEGQIGGMLSHDELFKAYPELLQRYRAEVVKNPEWMPDSLNTGEHTVTFGGNGKIAIQSKSAEEAKGKMMHELQHAIQRIEGWQSGANPNTYLDLRSMNAAMGRAKQNGGIDPETKLSVDKIKAIMEQATTTAFEKYLRTSGEVEARSAQQRRTLTPQERREMLPSQHYDLKPHQMIFDIFKDTTK